MMLCSAFASTLMLTTYGIDVNNDDKYFHMVEGVAGVIDEIGVPGRFPVEALPSLRFLPKWFPGGTYKQFAIDAKKFINSSLDELYTTALDGLVSPLGRLRYLRSGR